MQDLIGGQIDLTFTFNQCPLYPRKRILVERAGMSALQQKCDISPYI